jgi:hypothetical protein
MRATRLGLAAAALAIGLMVSAFQVIPPYLYTTTQSVRGTGEKTTLEHSASWSLHTEELAALVLPGFLGVDVHNGPIAQDTNRYWGHNPFKLNADSCGALLTFLAFLGLFVRAKRKEALFWFLGCAVALSYAMGTHSPLFELWYNIIPGIKNFRAPSMAACWLPLAMVFLAAPALKNLETPEGRKELFPGVWLFGVLCVLVLVSRFAWDAFNGVLGAVAILAFGVVMIKQMKLHAEKGGHGDPPLPVWYGLWSLPFLLVAIFFLNPVDANNQYFKPLDMGTATGLSNYVVTSFVLVALVCGVAWFALTSKLGLGSKVLVLAAVGAVEALSIDLPFVQEVPRAQYYNPKAVAGILQDPKSGAEHPRVFAQTRIPALSGNVYAAYGLRNADGFHDNELASSRAFRESVQNRAFFDLFNVGYLVVDTERGTVIQTNPDALGDGHLYYSWQGGIPQEAIFDSLSHGYDYKASALLEDSSLTSQNGSGMGSAVLEARPKMDEMKFSVESSSPALLFVSENYHPYWNATIDGKPAQVLRAFGNFMAVQVPTGKSVVDLNYTSKAVRGSLWVSLAGGALLLALLLFLGLKRFHRPA